MINTFQLSLQDNQELICVAELPLRLQEEISNAIELTK
jgi:hypothetical protein